MNRAASDPGPGCAHAGEAHAADRCLCAEDADLAVLRAMVAEIGGGKDQVVPLLHAIQERWRFLPKHVLMRIPELTEITAASVTAISTFYHQFRHRPVGRHLVRVCVGTACHVANAAALTAKFRETLGLTVENDTTEDQGFTVEEVACLGCCSLAPVVQIGSDMHGPLTPAVVPELIEEVQRPAGGVRHGRPYTEAGLTATSPEIRIALDSACIAVAADKVHAALRAAVADRGVPVRVKAVGCSGMACREPIVEVVVPGRPPTIYTQVTVEQAADIVDRHFPAPNPAKRVAVAASRAVDHLLTDQVWGGIDRAELRPDGSDSLNFLGSQVRIATEHYGEMDPLDLDEYLAHDGFRALEAAWTTLTPAAIIDTVASSGLRGRGGGGFPTGRKWATVAAQAGELKYIICNGDEGDPGAFMDRQLIENFPYRVIEGMAIAARATGATEGVCYVRSEYPLAIVRLTEALRRCDAAGILGDRVLGRGGPLRLRIFKGAGAFVCGEETALIRSVQGDSGMPVPRPPFPAERGLFGRPTLINNVETYANVPWILRHGAEAFAAYGTEHSKGTKVFALAGKVRRGGLIEVPMGITIRRIVEEIGDGIKDGRAFKAVQIGGPSGGCIPASLADTQIDYQALTRLGAIMGSGGLVVLDDGDCMVDIARFFMSFTQSEACGQCAPGRIGTRRLLDILERLCRGEGVPTDLDLLRELATLTTRASLCNLCKTAPNPVITSLRYFPEEYAAHLAGHCPAGKCKPLIHYVITDDCNGCTRCAQSCAAKAIDLTPYAKHVIDQEKCVKCDACRLVCPVGAVVIR
jgi:NADH-quinone oxidoreductase subunit F